MTLLTPRHTYKPFTYPQAYNFWEQQQNAFWLVSEINLDNDLYDWKFNLTDSERTIIGNILKSFVQSEVLIGDYWRKLGGVFQIPEISMMCAAFSSFETIHQVAYAHLNDTLGIDEWQEFLKDEVVMKRLGQLMEPPGKYRYNEWSINYEEDNWLWWKKDLAISLATFSAFGEGVALFSAFAILLSFSQRGLMRGLGEIIEMSIRDETLHSKAGIWLFTEFMKENKDIKDVKRHLYQANRDCVEIEDKFINSVFANRKLPNCNPEDLKQFIRQRSNNQMRALRLKPEYKIDKHAVDRLKWFNAASAGDQHTDFFSGRVTQYSRTDGWSLMWT